VTPGGGRGGPVVRVGVCSDVRVAVWDMAVVVVAVPLLTITIGSFPGRAKHFLHV